MKEIGCVIYVRAFVRNCPMEYQERACRAYAKNEGWEVVKVFREVPKKQSWRPSAMSKLKKFCSEHSEEIAYVLSYRPACLTKYKHQFFELNGFFRQLGMRLKFGCYYKLTDSNNEKTR